MKALQKTIIATAIIILCTASLFVFKTIPISRLWKQYAVLYVSNEISEQEVMDTLEAAGCKDVISFAVQKIPAMVSMCPVQKDMGHSDYLTKRNAYFFDRDNKCRLFYIPRIYDKNAASVLSSLQTSGIDSKAKLPWAAPCAAVLFFLLLLLTLKKRIVFALASCFPLLFSFSQPSAVSAAAVCMVLYCFYLAQNFYRRQKALKKLTNNMSVVVFFVSPILFTFFVSVTCGILYTASCISSFAALMLFDTYKYKNEQKGIFSPVMIRPSSVIAVMTVKNSRYMLLCALCVAPLLCASLMTTDTLFSKTWKKSLYIPSPSYYSTESALPTLRDYVIWNWNVVTYPYRSLNDTKTKNSFEIPNNGDTVKIPRYEMTNGEIREREETVFTFDSNFRRDVLKTIDALPYPAIEKLLKSQGDISGVVYASGSETASWANTIVLSLSFFIPLCGFVLYTLFGRKRI